MKHKMSILFYVKSSKAAKNGLLPIYQRITINGVRIELSTSRFVEKSRWNTSAGKMKGISEEARLINGYLDLLKYKIYETEKYLINNNVEINAQSFKNKLLGIEEKQRKLISIFEQHNKRMEELIGKEFSINTFKKYETTLSHTKKFLKHQYSINDISITQINIAFLNDFDFYLRTIKNCNNNSTVKYMRNFGKIVKQCYVNGWIELIRSKRKMVSIHIERDGSVSACIPEAITEDEILKLLKSKEYQIHKNLAQWSQLNQTKVESEYVNGQSVLYLGRNYRLQLTDNKLESLTFNKGYFYLSNSNKINARELFVSFYKEKLNEKLKPILKRYKGQLGVNPKEIKIMELQNRWATCTSRGNINFTGNVLWRQLMY